MKNNLMLIFALCAVCGMSACEKQSESAGTGLLTVTESITKLEFVGTEPTKANETVLTAPINGTELNASDGIAATLETVLGVTTSDETVLTAPINGTELNALDGTAATLGTVLGVTTSNVSENADYPNLLPIPQDSAVDLCEDFSVFGSELYGMPLTADDVSILKYYGTYNGCEAVVMYPKGLDMTADENHITVKYWEYYLSSGSLKIFLHREGTFAEIGEAYENGWLTNNDMKAIQYYNQNEDKTPERISWVYSPLTAIQASRERKIRGDYAVQQSEKRGWDMDYTDVSVSSYYGTYKNGEIVVMTVNELAYPDAMKYFNLAGYEFELPSVALDIHLYKDGEFTEISEAYKKGYLSDEDIEAAAYYNKYSGAYVSAAGNYPELEKLSAEKERQIKADFAEFNEFAVEEWVEIELYYGEYNGYEAVVMYSGAATADEKSFSVAGYEFWLSSGSYVIHLYKDGNFYELSEAYKSGLIGDEEVKNIAHYNHEGSYYAF